MRRGRGALGREIPIDSLPMLDNLLRDNDIRSLGGGLVRYFQDIAQAPLYDAKTEKERAEIGRKTQGAALDRASSRSGARCQTIRSCRTFRPR